MNTTPMNTTSSQANSQVAAQAMAKSPAKSLVIWWRWGRWKTLPWWSFGLACWQLLWPNPSERARLQFVIALAKLDHLGMVSLLNDCLW
jgi:hypothetical protein